MTDINKLFWEANIEEIKKGYIYDKNPENYTCLICGEVYEKGIIYPEGNKLYEASRAVKEHISKIHGSVFEYLINMHKKFTGLTDTQKEILMYFYQGLSDKEIVKEQGGGSTSTIRNHRFKLKEKQKQSKVFLAMMDLLNEEGGKNEDTKAKDEDQDENQKQNKEEFVTIHKGVTMMDDRFAITQKEKETITERYIKDGKLTNFPSKEKRKIIILQYMIQKFEAKKKYKEKEINEIIKKMYDDYVTIRRYFIQYGFMDREKDCSAYWVKL